MHKPADRIRNVALIGHRGSGKTSLHEALLFAAKATNRLGSVLDGTTVSDSEPDEQSRKMSISAALSSFEWSDRKINLLDTPGEPSFVADALGAMRVCESAVFVVNGVMGVEVSTRRLWARAEELDLARMVFVNMLDRERADFFRALESLKDAFGAHVVATEIPIGSEHDVSGIIDLVDMKAYRYENSSPATRDNCTEIEIPAELQELAQEYREKMMDEICEVSDALMERYLEGEEIAHDEIVATLKEGTNHGSLFPVTCGVATRNLGTNRLLDAIVEDLPSPVKHGDLELPEITLKADDSEPLYAYVFKTRADPFAGRINLFRVYQGLMRHDTQVMNTRTHGKERIGQLLVFSGKESGHADEFGPGDIGAVAKLKETRAGDWLAERDEPISMPQIELPAPVMAFAMEAQGDEDKVFTSLRRLQEEDPTIDLHRDQQTGDQIIAGLSQMHVEVIVDRLKERFGAEVTLKPPRVPYQETIRKPAKAHGRHKKQSGGRGQFGDCHISIEPRPAGEGFEFINHIKGGVIPTSFIPAVEKGVVEAMQSGPIAGCPVKDVSVTVFDGSYHTVDSSEMAFKLAGSIAMREAMAAASPALLEPIMLVTLSIPEESVGDVIGDLNSRRGRPQGMDSVGGGLTEVKAEVPMAEMLTYAPDLRSLTGGQGDYTMEFLRYEEVPAHLQQKVVEQASEEEAVSA
jgi:elongation factor G